MDQWLSGSSTSVSASWFTLPGFDERGDDAAGSAGVREPRHPLRPLDTAGVALDLPPVYDDAPQGVWTVTPR